MTDLMLTLDRLIAAPQDRIYRAWLNADSLARFMLPVAGASVPEAATDPREGGRFRVVMRVDGRDLPHGGTYLELVPHNRIRFSWESHYSTEGSMVTIDLAPEGSATRLTLTHVRFPSTESRDNHHAGWTRILAVLDDLLSDGP